MNTYIDINKCFGASKKFLSLSFFLFLQAALFSQVGLVVNNDAYIVLKTSATTDSMFVVVDNPSDGAISTSGTGGNIITTYEKNYIKWNIGTNTGTYTVPFTTALTAVNSSESKIPLSVNITSGGIGDGNIKFSSYTDNNNSDNFRVSDYKPSDVLNVDHGNSDNSSNVVNRWWVIDANDYTVKPTTTLDFNYDDDEAHLDPANTMTELSIFPQRWNPLVADWDDVILSGTLNTTTNSLSGITVSAVNFFRSWALVNSNTPLPITLTGFTAACTENQVVLSWATATELNNDFFTVERSADMLNWKNIATLEGGGTSQQTLIYTYTDTEPERTTSYYRLKQTDYNGDFEYFEIISTNCIKGNTEERVSVYPNPFVNELTVHIGGYEADHPIKYSIYHTSGQLYKGGILEPWGGVIRTNDLPIGAYVLKILVNKSSVRYIKLIKVTK